MMQPQPKSPLPVSGRWARAIASAASATLVSLALWTMPALAKDPFRTENPRPIGERTEAAFRTYFELGDYVKAEELLKQADPNEPLSQALRAALAYVKSQDAKVRNDKEKQDFYLSEVERHAANTRATAEALVANDPLRGNLYLAVGHLMDAGTIALRDGIVKGAPRAMGKLQQAFRYMDEAEKHGPTDPELNLLRGYMDLLTGLYLPFSSPDKALKRLDQYAGPRYLVDRGMALGYRDMEQPEQALEAAKRAIAATPDNPEIMYLKAQILVEKKDYKQALVWFNKALEVGKERLPWSVLRQMTRERDRTQRRVAAGG